MKNLFIFLILFISLVSFPANVWQVSPASCAIYVSGSCIIPCPVPYDYNFDRSQAWVGLFTSMSVSSSDVGKEFYFDIFNSKGFQLYNPKHKFKIALDSQKCCPSERCSEWEGGLTSIANYTYYPIYNFSYSTGHQMHTGSPSQVDVQTNCPCSMGFFHLPLVTCRLILQIMQVLQAPGICLTQQEHIHLECIYPKTLMEGFLQRIMILSEDWDFFYTI